MAQFPPTDASKLRVKLQEQVSWDRVYVAKDSSISTNMASLEFNIKRIGYGEASKEEMKRLVKAHEGEVLKIMKKHREFSQISFWFWLENETKPILQVICHPTTKCIEV